jgi:predicted N-acetyltransferase YhbS
MAVTVRRYKLYQDFEPVGRLLRENFGRYELGGNVPQPFWEYAHTHPAFNHRLTHRFGVWEEDGSMAGIAFYEMDLGEACFACRRGYERLKPEMLRYAEDELSVLVDGRRHLEVRVYDYESGLREALAARGFGPVGGEDITVFDYDRGIPAPELPAGYSIISLEDENDPYKINAVLWKGFDHGPEPDDDFDCRLQMQSGPSFSKELTTIIKAPDGEYACYAGIWMDGVNDFAYLEPLATVPEHRGKGLATAALREGMRKTRERGAAYCIGGPVPFYTAIGFRTVCRKEVWRKDW